MIDEELAKIMWTSTIEEYRKGKKKENAKMVREVAVKRNIKTTEIKPGSGHIVRSPNREI